MKILLCKNDFFGVSTGRTSDRCDSPSNWRGLEELQSGDETAPRVACTELTDALAMSSPCNLCPEHQRGEHR